MWAEHPEVEAIAIVGIGSSRSAVPPTCESSRIRRPAADRPGRPDGSPRSGGQPHPPDRRGAQRAGSPVPVMNSIPELLAYIRNLTDVTPPDRVIFVPKVYSTRARGAAVSRIVTSSTRRAPRHAAMTDNGYASVLNSVALQRTEHRPRHTAAANGKIIKDEQGRADRTDPRCAPAPWRVAAREASPRMPTWLGAEGHAARLQRSRASPAPSIAVKGPEGFRVYQELRQQNELTVRSYRHVPDQRSGNAGPGAAGHRAHSVRDRLGR